MTSRDYFKGKRVALIGLGPHGEMVEDAKFMIKQGALLSIYDLRSEARLKSHLVFLRSVGLANYICGSIPADDLLDMDIIILSHEYPRDSTFLKGIKEKKIPIEYPETLFFKLAPPVTLVGVMGSCGKATVISMLVPMIEEACASAMRMNGEGNQQCFVADPESGEGVLAHLKKIKNGDILIMRIEERMVRELESVRISPHVAIYVSPLSKFSYDESPFNILKHQTYNNFIIASDEIIDSTRLYKFQSKAKMLRTKAALIPVFWEFTGKSHDRENAALALQASKLFKVEDETVQRILKDWKPLKGRLEFVKKVKGIEFYNDSTSTTPNSTIAGIISLSENRDTILILGGTDGDLDYRELYAILPQYTHTVVLLPGSGTMKERGAMQKIDHAKILSAPSIEEAVRLARENARVNDKVLFSPGFDAGGFDVSRKERGERFVRVVRGL
ncbi:MAG: cyanophycin synthetase [Patescibacteria group bacterium]